jgi:hypothetical protein
MFRYYLLSRPEPCVDDRDWRVLRASSPESMLAEAGKTLPSGQAELMPIGFGPFLLVTPSAQFAA